MKHKNTFRKLSKSIHVHFKSPLFAKKNLMFYSLCQPPLKNGLYSTISIASMKIILSFNKQLLKLLDNFLLLTR